MTTYNRIPVPMGMGKAILEYSDSLCRITLQLKGIGTDKLYKPYLLWEDSYMLLPQPLNIDKSGRCSLRCQLDAEQPDKIRAVAVISEDLEPIAIGYINGEYNWRKCFMMKESTDTTSEPAGMSSIKETEQKTEEAPPAADTKQVFKSIVCHLSDDLQELKQYAQMPDFDNSSALFDTHERVSPFYGCQGEWIKINLKELAQINSLWKYMNNPLVLYSCRHYHYLLLGRQNGALTLGIPWEYDPSYRLEAGIQGFTDIKPQENAPLERGAKCYLLMTL